MRDPVMPPVLILFGVAFIFWGGRKLRHDLTAPNSEFCANERIGQQHKLEGPLMRVAHALDSLGILLIGVVVFAFGLIDLFR